MPRGRPRKNQPKNPDVKPEVTENKIEETKDIVTPMDETRRNKLKEVMRDINKDKSQNTVIDFASTMEGKQRLSWGYKVLDELTGGLICGNFVTIWGSKSCGKSSIGYQAIATNQKLGKICAYIDMERSYDTVWAENFNVKTEDLVYIRCFTAEEAMDSVIKLCQEKVVDLIVLDSIQGMSPKGEQKEGKKLDKQRSVEDDSMALLARKLSQFFRMAVPYVSNANCAVLLIGQSRLDLGSFIKLETLSGGNALMHNSRIILRFRRGQGADAPTEKIETDDVDEKGNIVKEERKVGFDLVIKVDKAQAHGCMEGTEKHIPFYFDSGIKE